MANRVETDVTWEWNSPKRQNISETSKRKPKTKLCLIGKKIVKDKIIKKADVVNDGEKGGFFKFEEELKSICLSNNENTVSVKKSSIFQTDVIMESVDLPTDKINNSNEENLVGNNSNYSNFFNDSDFDSIIMQCKDKVPIPVNKNISKNGCENQNNSSSASFSRVTSLPTNNFASIQVNRSQNFQRTVTMPIVLEKNNPESCDSPLNFSAESNFGKLYTRVLE